MWNGKKKAITFSFDDGTTQDLRLIKILNTYGLKATFNINSGLLGTPNVLETGDKLVILHNKVNASQVKEWYAGHEVAVHTLTHPHLVQLNDETVIRQVEEDRKALESLCGYPIIGMAYPCGGENNDERVAKLIRENTPIRYARTIKHTYSYDFEQENLLRFNPTIHFLDEKMEEIAKNFVELQTESAQLLYIWGHSFELDIGDETWERFENLCKILSGYADIFYGTNNEL